MGGAGMTTGALLCARRLPARRRPGGRCNAPSFFVCRARLPQRPPTQWYFCGQIMSCHGHVGTNGALMGEIFIVDDDPVLDAALTTALNGQGFNVVNFNDGQILHQRRAQAHAGLHPGRRLFDWPSRPRRAQVARRAALSGPGSGHVEPPRHPDRGHGDARRRTGFHRKAVRSGDGGRPHPGNDRSVAAGSWRGQPAGAGLSRPRA